MRIRLRCLNPQCGHVIDVSLEPGGRASCPAAEAGTMPAPQCAAACPRCGHKHELDLPAALKDGLLMRCPCCGGEELYVRKDFPQRLGLTLVVLVAGLSLYLFGRGRLEWALGVLVALVLVDLLIYRLVATRTVCYRCRAEFRDVPVNPEHKGFDLATEERYR